MSACSSKVSLLNYKHADCCGPRQAAKPKHTSNLRGRVVSRANKQTFISLHNNQDALFDHTTHAHSSTCGSTPVTRRSHLSFLTRLALALTPTAFNSEEAFAVPEPEVTCKVYFDVGVCAESVNDMQRTLGSDVCEDIEPLGRVVIGLYGNATPNTVNNISKLVMADKGQGYKGTVFHTIRQGQFVAAGRQGPKRLGLLNNVSIPPNDDVTSSASFRLDSTRPGNVSLVLIEDFQSGMQKGLSEFVIATGPAPAVDLDGRAIVFGRVLEGLDVVAAMSTVPTFRPPSERIRAINRVAGYLGDDRAPKARAAWDKPQFPVVITDCGMMPRDA